MVELAALFAELTEQYGSGVAEIAKHWGFCEEPAEDDFWALAGALKGAREEKDESG